MLPAIKGAPPPSTGLGSLLWTWRTAFLLLAAAALPCAIVYFFATPSGSRLPEPIINSGDGDHAASQETFSGGPPAINLTSNSIIELPVDKDKIATNSTVTTKKTAEEPMMMKNKSEEEAENKKPEEKKKKKSEEPATELERVLSAAATADRTVILTTLTAAWCSNGSVLDLFVESFRIGEGTLALLNHLVIICLDKTSYETCISTSAAAAADGQGYRCYALETEGVDFDGGELRFMSDRYFKMVWRRTQFFQEVLQAGYNFIFTDTDIMWFRDPRTRFSSEADFEIACDRFNGNSLDRTNPANGGFQHVRSNNRTLAFYRYWYSARDKYPGKNEQEVLDLIKEDAYVASELAIKMRFLDTMYFGGFCQVSRDFNHVITMHANCCVGLGKKINDLGLVLEDWKKFSALPEEEKAKNKISWRVPNKCSM